MKVTYRTELLDEDLAVRGNALDSGDPAVDKAAEDEILRRLDRGETWAWCTVKVTAHLCVGMGDDVAHVFEGAAYLGACSYATEAEALAVDDYRESLQAEALESLCAALRRAEARGRLAAEALKAIEVES